MTSERLDGVDLKNFVEILLLLITTKSSRKINYSTVSLVALQTIEWKFDRSSNLCVYSLLKLFSTDLVHRRFAQRVGGSPVGIVDQAKKDTSSLRDSLEGQNEDQPAVSTSEGLQSLTVIVGEMAASVG